MMKPVLKFLLVIFLLSLIGAYFVRNSEDLSVLTHVSATNLIVLMTLAFATHIVYAMELLIIVNKMHSRSLPFFPWFKIFLVSRFLNLFVTQGANLYRSVKLKREYQFSYTHSISMVSFFAWFQSVLSLCLCQIFLFTADTTILGSYLAVTLSVLTLLVFAMPFVLHYVFKRFRIAKQKFQWYGEKVEEMFTGFFLGLKDMRFMFTLTALFVVYFVLNQMFVHHSFAAIGVPVGVHSSALFTATIVVSRTFNVVPSNLGVTEVICGALSEALQGKIGYGIIISGIARVVDFVLTAALGILFSQSIFPRKVLDVEGDSR